jgi:flagellar basal body L-ring protein FlgH
LELDSGQEVNVSKETMPMVENNEEKEWRALIEGLTAEPAKPLPAGEVAPMFADPKARQRVGDVITKAILGVPLYKLYCGEPAGQT